jgi:hypothetical protein
VNAVTCRPNDLGHIRPHRIETFVREKPSVTGTGNRYLPVVRLVPDVSKHLRTPILVTKFFVLGIRHTEDNILFAFLHTTHTTDAVNVRGIDNLRRIESTVPVNIVNTRIAFNAFHTAETAVILYRAKSRHRKKPGVRRFNFNVIFRWHILFSL